MQVQAWTNGLGMVTMFFLKDLSPMAPSMDVVSGQDGSPTEMKSKELQNSHS